MLIPMGRILGLMPKIIIAMSASCASYLRGGTLSNDDSRMRFYRGCESNFLVCKVKPYVVAPED